MVGLNGKTPTSIFCRRAETPVICRLKPRAKHGLHKYIDVIPPLIILVVGHFNEPIINCKKDTTEQQVDLFFISFENLLEAM